MTSSNLQKIQLLKIFLKFNFFDYSILFKYAIFFASDNFESKYNLLTNNLENLKLIE